MNTQQYSCSDCKESFSTIFETFLHIYTCHQHCNCFTTPVIATGIIARMVLWQEWDNILGKN